MKRLGIVLVAAVLGSYASAFGEAGRWSSGWGQGTAEYIVVSAEGNTLYIACSDSRPATMTLTVGKRQYGYGEDMGFDLIIDDHEVTSPFDADSRAGSGNFLYAWNAIRKAKTLKAKTGDGKLISLPLKEAARTLPKSQTKEYVCLGIM